MLRDEAAGGVALVAGTVAALLWANLAPDGYAAVWEAHALGLSLRDWVDDGAMALFFLVVGLEVKRELVTGELANPRAAALPVVAAACGVLAPALIFLALTAGTPYTDGWAVPAATDIAFAVGVVALLGDRVPPGARLLLLTIAVVDDVIAIVIIAVAYAADLSPAWLLGALACVGVVLALRRLGAASPWAYVLPAVALWVCVRASGVHPTIAGVALGLLTPARPVRGREVLEDLFERLQPVSALLVVPVFALANAGVVLTGGALGDAAGTVLPWAVAAGLVAGKLLGVGLGTAAAVRLGIGVLPAGVRRAHVVGVAAVAGIGFTVSIFVAGLAFEDPRLVEDAKLGTFAGSLVSAALGAALLVRAARRG